MIFKSCLKCTTETGRHPGCHDHCERYKQERAEWDRQKAITNANKDIRVYTFLNVGRAKDAKAKRDRSNRGRKWFSKGH